MSLNGKVILITGAAKRLGHALAVSLAKEGAAMAIHYYTSQKEARLLLKQLNTKGHRAALFKADLKSVSQIKKMVQQVMKHFGHIDVLINNAALFYATPFEKTTEKEWNLFIDTNLKAPFFCAQAVIRHSLKQKQRGLKIINILDSSGPKTRENYLPYWISKTGLSAMTEVLAKIFSPTSGRSSITVNGIAPGPILFSEDQKKFKHEITIDPLDIVSAVNYIIEDKNALTGNILLIDKGRRYIR